MLKTGDQLFIITRIPFIAVFGVLLIYRLDAPFFIWVHCMWNRQYTKNELPLHVKPSVSLDFDYGSFGFEVYNQLFLWL